MDTAQPNINRSPDQRGIVINRINVSQYRRFDSDMATYMNAVKQAENTYMPDRYRLMQMYHDYQGESAWQSAWRKRTRYCKNKPLIYCDQDGNVDQAMTLITKTLWFDELIAACLDPIVYGTGLIEPELKGGVIKEIHVMPRTMIAPERGLIYTAVKDPTTAVRYREEYADAILEIGKARDLGLMQYALPYLLYMRGMWGDWATFSELFGQPIRQYTYDPRDPNSRLETQKAAEQMGNAAYIIVPEGVSLELHKGADNASTENYDRHRIALEGEIMNLLLGNTMTTRDGSSRSQAEVHKSEQLEVHFEDLRRIEYLLSHHARDWMRYYGLPLREGYYFKYEDDVNLSMEQRLDAYVKLLEKGLEIPERFFYDEFNIPKPTIGERYLGSFELSKQSVSGTLLEQLDGHDAADHNDNSDVHQDAEMRTGLVPYLRDLYRNAGHGFKARAPKSGYPDMDTLLEQLWNSTIKAGDLDDDLMQYYMQYTWGSFTTGFDEDYDLLPLDSEKKRMMESFWKYSHEFTAAKTATELTEYAGMVNDYSSFEEFANAVKARHKDFGVNFLRAEEQVFEQSAISAKQWQQVQETSRSRPNLRYVTVGDQRVRDDHKRLDDLVKPVTDAFWDRHYPPNGYGCRCDVEATAARVSTDTPQIELRDEFAHNPGKTGRAFNTHPYISNVPDNLDIPAL